MSGTSSTTLIDSLETAIVVVSSDLCCLQMNEASEALFCSSRNVIVGESIANLLPANQDLIDHCKHSLLSGTKLRVRDATIHLPHWKRSTRVDYSLTPIPLSEDSYGVVVELHEAEQRARLSNDDKQVGQFETAISIVKGLSHEIKNPLAGIRGAAQLLQRVDVIDQVGCSQISEFTDVIMTEVDRLANLLDRMSTLKKEPRREAVDIHQLIAHCASLTQTEFGDGLEIIGDYDTSLPKPHIDKDQMVQVLLNLLKNAGQALERRIAEGKGTIKLTTRVAYPDPTRLLMPLLGIQISVTDNGAGLTTAMRERAFLPMVTDKPQGTGLGLAIAQEIIQNHGGFIRIEDAESGAHFSIFIPLGANDE